MPDDDNNDEAMQINPQRAKQLVENLSAVKTRIQSVNPTGKNIRLVAVSKLKPATDILALHTAPTPHLHFGENYQQELLTKSTLLPRSVRWHFIGALQSNKCRPLAQEVPNLWCVESVDSAKKAALLDKGRGALVEGERAKKMKEKEGEGEGRTRQDEGMGIEGEKLRVFVQVNTSGEESKSGVEPEAAVELCRFVSRECRFLRLQGLMTIGAIARSRAATEGETENEDFRVLGEVRDRVAGALGVEEGELELSMGMSADFEAAVRAGSDEVRVGSTIFGERPPKKDAKIKGSVEEGDS